VALIQRVVGLTRIEEETGHSVTLKLPIRTYFIQSKKRALFQKLIPVPIAKKIALF